MREFLLLAVLLLTGCTMNLYWTDAVVYGEHHANGERQCAPIPLDLKVKP